MKRRSKQFHPPESLAAFSRKLNRDWKAVWDIAAQMQEAIQAPTPSRPAAARNARGRREAILLGHMIKAVQLQTRAASVAIAHLRHAVELIRKAGGLPKRHS